MQIILFCMASVLAINFTRYLLRIWRARKIFELLTPISCSLVLKIAPCHDHRRLAGTKPPKAERMAPSNVTPQITPQLYDRLVRFFR